MGTISHEGRQRLLAVLRDVAHPEMTTVEICRRAGYHTSGPWRVALRDPDFRAEVQRVGYRLPHQPRGRFRTDTQNRLWEVLQDPANRERTIRAICALAHISQSNWYAVLRDEPFRMAVASLGMRVPVSPSADVAAFGGFSRRAQQRFWTVLQDPANHTLTPLAIARQAGYTTYGPWYQELRDPAFREWVYCLGIAYTPYPWSPYFKRLGGPIPLATSLDGEWMQDRIDVRRLTTEYPKHKRMYCIDFSFIVNPHLKGLIKRYFRADRVLVGIHPHQCPDDAQAHHPGTRTALSWDGLVCQAYPCYDRTRSGDAWVDGFGQSVSSDDHRTAIANADPAE